MGAHMDIIKFIRCNREVSELLEEICDVSILPILKEPQNQNGQLKYNIAGMTFAKEKSGSEYILLEDDSIGYWGSEGKVGRIADNLTDFFELIVNCPYWIDYLDCSQYSSKERLRRFANIIYEEHVEMFEEDMDVQLGELQKELANKLNICLYEDVVNKVLIKLFDVANRKPGMTVTYTERDGRKIESSGSVFF